MNNDTTNLTSPIHGGELLKGENGNYYSPYDDLEYMIFGDKVLPVADPYSDGTASPSSLSLLKDGMYQNEKGQLFTFIKDKRVFVPLFVPDETMEPGVIENGCLVTESGRSFNIADDGKILTPEEMAIRAEKQAIEDASLARFQQRMWEIDEAVRNESFQFFEEYLVACENYDEHMEKIDSLYAQKRNDESNLSAIFIMDLESPTIGFGSLCHYSLREKGKEVDEVLYSASFKYDEEFKNRILIPATDKFILGSKIASARAYPLSSDSLEMLYLATDGSCLTISNIDFDSAISVIKNVSHVENSSDRYENSDSLMSQQDIGTQGTTK